MRSSNQASEGLMLWAAPWILNMYGRSAKRRNAQTLHSEHVRWILNMYGGSAKRQNAQTLHSAEKVVDRSRRDTLGSMHWQERRIFARAGTRELLPWQLSSCGRQREGVGVKFCCNSFRNEATRRVVGILSYCLRHCPLSLDFPVLPRRLLRGSRPRLEHSSPLFSICRFPRRAQYRLTFAFGLDKREFNHSFRVRILVAQSGKRAIRRQYYLGLEDTNSLVSDGRRSTVRPQRRLSHFKMQLCHELCAQGGLLQLRNAAAAMILLVLVRALLQSRRAHVKSQTEDSTRSEKIVGELGNLDEAPARRRVRAAFQKTQENLDHLHFKESLDGVKAEEWYEVNSRGIEIFTRSWFPETQNIRASVFICHGYGDTCTFFFEGVARKLAKAGYAVFGMDYPGFGLSAGLHGFIPDFDKLVDDVVENYSKIKERSELKKLPCFLFGESMGGAVALKAHLNQPTAWDGALLVAPMCKIAADMYPPWLLMQILIVLSYFIPRAKLVPEKNLAEMAFRDLKKKEQTAYNVAAYKDRPRLKTALELLKATDFISDRLRQISLPLLILHGACDIVTDPSVSKALHEQASSGDKTLFVYENAWHSVLEGEPDEVILQVLSDIRSWLDSHSVPVMDR